MPMRSLDRRSHPVWRFLPAGLVLGGIAAASIAGTRDDLDAARRRVHRLEAEEALTASRKPYVVLDLQERILLFRLTGMTVREIPLQETAARGLAPALSKDSPPEAFGVAGIFTLQEKEGDPRLAPLTPEQIEAGLDDENAADALPPDPPSHYALRFKQPVTVQVIGAGGAGPLGGLAGRLRSFWHRLWRSAPAGSRGEDVVTITLRLEAPIAHELYRANIPGERWLILPPSGLVLPGAGQELPRTIRPPHPAPRPTPPPATPPGVPFQIPPPVDSETAAPALQGGDLPPERQPSQDGTAPRPEAVPAPTADDLPSMPAPAPEASPEAGPPPS